MARELTVNVVVLNEQQDPVILTAGSTVPAEYADQLGDHCFAKQGESSQPETGGDAGGLQFKSKAEALEYAEANGLDVDQSLKADAYKAAVVEAAAAKSAAAAE